MICLNCNCSFHRRPARYYFCSEACWEVKAGSSAWRILPAGPEPLPAPVAPINTRAAHRKPKRITAGLRKKVINRLKSDERQMAIAIACGIAQSTVSMIGMEL